MDAKEKKALAESMIEQFREQRASPEWRHLGGRLTIIIDALAQYIDNLEGMK